MSSRPPTVQNVATKFAARLLKEAADGFPEDVVEQAFDRAKAVCECNREACGHEAAGHCTQALKYEDRTTDGDKKAGWQAHHKVARNGTNDVLSNCEILCVPCHYNTPSFGRS